MPRAGEGVGGGPPRFRHGWIPVGASVADVQRTAERIRAARARPPDLQHEITAHGGFTFNPRTGKLLKPGTASGYAVAVPGTEQAVGSGHLGKAEFRKAMADVIMNHKAEIDNGAVVGGWYSPDRDQYMVELTHVLPPDQREAAIREGQRRNQEAIFDLSTGETIPTGGTGDIRVTGVLTEEVEAQRVTDQILERARAVEPTVTPDLTDLAAQVGGRMQGLKYRIKEPDSLSDKLVRKAHAKNMTVQQYGDKVADALRYTTILPPDRRYATGTRDMLRALRSRGYRIVSMENTWDPSLPYMGVNTNIATPSGYVFELQFHTDQSFRVKQEQHGLYKEARKETTPPDVVSKLTKQMQDNSKAMIIPPGAATVGQESDALLDVAGSR